MTESPDTTGAGRSAQPSPLPTPAPSFARRHPFYAAFGVLAALSLFSALWPLSAVLTGALVLARATGLDRRAVRAAGEIARRIAVRLGLRSTPPKPPDPPEAPPSPVAASVRGVSRELADERSTPRLRRAELEHPRPRTRRRREVAAAEQDRALPGL
ncbi:MAG TPA: hypothetical protein VJU79_01135 [Candidatus Dormibacteraeota bacterium]|nr:hypothetical protein [Candidatus Dormibacteraeota bacterium]